MSGELNGTQVVISNGTGEIVGQMTATLTLGGTPIDISNKSAGDNVALLDANLASQQLVVTGDIVYNDDAQYQKVRADALTGVMDTYTTTYGTTGESYAATMMPNAMSDSLPHGDKVSTNITFSSSGAITYTPAT